LGSGVPNRGATPLFGETVQRVEHRGLQGRLPHERIELCAYPPRARRAWSDEKLRVRVEVRVRPPLVDGVIELVVPVEWERLFGEEVRARGQAWGPTGADRKAKPSRASAFKA
jgi:hypothetical protein